MLMNSRSDHDVAVGCHREHFEQYLGWPLSIRRIEKYEFLCSFGVEMFKRELNPAIRFMFDQTEVWNLLRKVLDNFRGRIGRAVVAYDEFVVEAVCGRDSRCIAQHSLNC